MKEEKQDVGMLNDHPYSFNETRLESDENFLIEEHDNEEVYTESISDKKFHKFNKLTGKAACKYCESVFKTKEILKNHFSTCKYLQCDEKNFICRRCKKELSKKTFSNHLHIDNLNCQYCFKSFVNPRNLK